MKPIKIIALFSALFFTSALFAQTARVNREKKTFDVTGSLNNPYIIYGYEQPDKKSKKIIVFSAYDSYVNNNGYNYPLGAYYETIGLKTGDKIEYAGDKNGYAELNYIAADKTETKFYVRKGFIRFD